MLAQHRSAALSFLTILVVCLNLVGCQKYLAENQIRKTRQIIANIEQTYDGAQYEPERLNSLKQRVDQATQQLETDAGAAKSLASQARTEAEGLLETVRPRHAGAKLAEANQEIVVADVNELSRLEPERYQRIREIINDAQQANTDSRWDNVIRYSTDVVREVSVGLAPLSNRAVRLKSDAEQALTELRVVGGPNYAPEVVITVQDDINTADRIFDRDRDYRAAANKFEEATRRAESGIVQVLREKSRERLEQIEALLSTALIEGAEHFRQREYADAIRLYDDLQAQYVAGSYSTVLEGADNLTPTAQRLVIETKRAASDERIASLTETIRGFEEGGVLEYIPGSLDRLRQFLARSGEIRARDTEEAFDEVKQLMIEAADESDRVRTAFARIAEERIEQARGELETTRSVFDEMDYIFEPLSGEMTDDERAFEAQKRARQTELGSRLQEANIRHVTATIRMQNEEYRTAIILSGEVAEQSKQILSDIYHVVAHNASIELAKLISRYERDGARQYAPEELARSAERLEEVKGLVAQGEYLTAVQRSAEARAEVELMAQRISGRATEDLREARRTLDIADSENTRVHRADMLEEVSQLIEQASQDLQADRLKLAVETANRATLLALQAEREANQLAAEARIAEANKNLMEAQDAGAELYAGRETEESRRLLSSARSLYDTGDYRQAEALAASAGERANAALFRKINQAEAEIASARAVGAWDFDHSRLARANTQVREARSLLAEGRFRESGILAESAAATAHVLANDTRNNTFLTRTERIRSNLESGQRQGINFFQPEEAIAARRRLAELQNTYTLENYELVMSEVEKLEGALRMTLDGTDTLVTTVAEQQSRRLDGLMDAGADQYAAAEARQARNNLRFALLDYNRGTFQSAHTNLVRAIDLIDTIEHRGLQDRYSRQVEELFAEYNDSQIAFSNILTLQPRELKELSLGPGGAAQSVAISAQITPNEFRRQVDEFYSRALVIEVPPGLEAIHQSVMQAFTEGRVAAIHFEKLAVLNYVATTEAMHLIDQAFIRMNNSNRLVANVQTQLTSDEVRFRLVNAPTVSLAR